MQSNIPFIKGRTVVFEPEAEDTIERLSNQYPRIYEGVAGIEWALSNEPEQFPMVENSSLRKALMKPSTGVPELQFWFTFSGTTVRILVAETLPNESERED